MAKETERKFLVVNDTYRQMACAKYEIVQGYLCADEGKTVRVRIKDDRAFITIKGATTGCTRDEWEYEIPVADARDMLRLHIGRLIEKTRRIVDYEGCRWEVDEFHGSYDGLTVAEIELPTETSAFALPPFVGDEVTGVPEYYNSAMALAK